MDEIKNKKQTVNHFSEISTSQFLSEQFVLLSKAFFNIQNTTCACYNFSYQLFRIKKAQFFFALIKPHHK